VACDIPSAYSCNTLESHTHSSLDRRSPCPRDPCSHATPSRNAFPSHTGTLLCPRDTRTPAPKHHTQLPAHVCTLRATSPVPVGPQKPQRHLHRPLPAPSQGKTAQLKPHAASVPFITPTPSPRRKTPGRAVGGVLSGDPHVGAPARAHSSWTRPPPRAGVGRTGRWGMDTVPKTGAGEGTHIARRPNRCGPSCQLRRSRFREISRRPGPADRGRIPALTRFRLPSETRHRRPPLSPAGLEQMTVLEFVLQFPAPGLLPADPYLGAATVSAAWRAPRSLPRRALLSAPPA
jgi:hypothetical protein